MNGNRTIIMSYIFQELSNHDCVLLSYICILIISTYLEVDKICWVTRGEPLPQCLTF